jgi:hypothetical protein
MTITEKVVIAGCLLAAAGLIAMNLTVTSAYDALAEEGPGFQAAPPKTPPVYATTRAVAPPIVFPKDQADTYDALGLSDEQRVRMARIQAVGASRQRDIWQRLAGVSADSDKGRQELARLREIMVSMEEDLKRELGDKYAAFEELRAERMGIARRPDASVD